MSVYDNISDNKDSLRSTGRLGVDSSASLDLSNRKACRVYLFANTKSLKPTVTTDYIQARLDFQNRSGLWADIAETIAKHVHGVCSSDDVHIAQVVYYKRRGHTPYGIHTDLDCIRASVETGHSDLDQDNAVKIGVLYTAKRKLVPETDLKELIALHGTAEYTCEPKHKDVVKGLRQLRADGILCDIQLIVDDQIYFNCHRVVLASVCKYFLSRIAKVGHRNYYLYDVDSDSVAMVLDYIYGESLNIGLGNVLHVHKAASLLQVDSVASFCEQVIYGLSTEEMTIIKMIRAQMDMKLPCIQPHMRSLSMRTRLKGDPIQPGDQPTTAVGPAGDNSKTQVDNQHHVTANLKIAEGNVIAVNLVKNVHLASERSDLSNTLGRIENVTTNASFPGQVFVKQECIDSDFKDNSIYSNESGFLGKQTYSDHKSALMDTFDGKKIQESEGSLNSFHQMISLLSNPPINMLNVPVKKEPEELWTVSDSLSTHSVSGDGTNMSSTTVTSTYQPVHVSSTQQKNLGPLDISQMPSMVAMSSECSPYQRTSTENASSQHYLRDKGLNLSLKESAALISKAQNTEVDSSEDVSTEVMVETRKETRKRKTKTTAKRNLKKFAHTYEEGITNDRISAPERFTNSKDLTSETNQDSVPVTFEKECLNRTVDGIKDEYNEMVANCVDMKKKKEKHVHGKKSSIDGKHMCVVCSLKFTSVKALLIHRTEVHDKEEEQTAYVCNICGRTLTSVMELYEHQLLEQNLEHMFFSQDIPCPECGEFMSQKGVLVEHMRMEHFVKLYTCLKKACDFLTQDQNEYEKHKNQHSESPT